MRTEGPTRKFGDWTAAIVARGEEYRRKVECGEVEPPKRDASGNIISSPSTLEPNPIRDAGLPFISAHIA